MLTRKELDGLVRAMRASGVTSLDMQGTNQRLRLVLDPRIPAWPVSLAVVDQDTGHDRSHALSSPMAGRFVRSGADDGLRSLGTGMEVDAGEVLGYVCDGQVRVVLVAPVGGVIVGRVPRSGKPFAAGDTVLTVEART